MDPTEEKLLEVMQPILIEALQSKLDNDPRVTSKINVEELLAAIHLLGSFDDLNQQREVGSTRATTMIGRAIGIMPDEVQVDLAAALVNCIALLAIATGHYPSTLVEAFTDDGWPEKLVSPENQKGRGTSV